MGVIMDGCFVVALHCRVFVMSVYWEMHIIGHLISLISLIIIDDS